MMTEESAATGMLRGVRAGMRTQVSQHTSPSNLELFLTGRHEAIAAGRMTA